MTESGRPALPYDYLPKVPAFDLDSDDVADGEEMPEAHRADQMGVGGGNESPGLSWSGFPPETKSFALTLYDPDAPTGSGFWHWSVVNISASTTRLARGAGAAGGASLPAGATQFRNDAGYAGYIGAAPPPGDAPHRYVFAVHALDTERLELDETASPAYVGFNVVPHTIGRALLIATFAR